MNERPDEDRRVDVVLYPSGDVKAVPAGTGADVVRSYHERQRSTGTLRLAVLGVVSVLVVVYSLLVVRNLLLGILAAGLVVGLGLALPRLTGTDAALLDADVSVRTAREQWEATPVSALTEQSGGRERERDHAVEGEV